MALPARCWGASGAAVRCSLALLACAATLLPAAAADPAAPGRRAALELLPAAGAARLSAGDGAPAWRGRLDYYFKKQYFAPAIFQSDPCGRPYAPNCTALPGRRYPYEEIIVDPTGATDRPVLRTTYPEGSGTFGSQMPGGTTFYAFPTKNDAIDEGRTVNSFSRYGAALEYSVFFPADFEFGKGGKLPGLVGGRTNGRGCAGGAASEDCFSARLNFKADGIGQLYLYVPGPAGFQADDFCSFYPPCFGGDEGDAGGDGENSGPVAASPPPPAAPPPPPFQRAYPCNFCHPTMGMGIGRGTWQWKRGEWNTIRLSMRLNTPGLRDGAVRVEYNGATVLQYDKMNWRLNDRVVIEGVVFTTFFGGSSVTSPKTQSALFRDIKMFYDGPAVGAAAAARPRPLAAGGVAAGVQSVRTGYAPEDGWDGPEFIAVPSNASAAGF